MFVFYFGVVADITPPVALAAYAGAGIAGSNPMRTGVVASRLAVGAFIIPYIFVLSPVLLLQDVTLASSLQMLVTSLAGMFGVAVAMGGFLRTTLALWERALLLVAGVMMIDPNVVTDVVGLALMAAVVASQVWKARRAAADAGQLSVGSPEVGRGRTLG